MPSNWDTVQGVKETLKYAHWPNPFNAIRNIQRTACEPNLEFLVDFLFPVAAEFFWTNFIPSPKEVFRKVLWGQYHCGTPLRPTKKAPMDIIWGRGTSRVLVGMLNPGLQALFYMWAAGAAFEALATWTSMVYAMESCEQDPNSCIGINASGDWMSAHPGVPVGWDEVWGNNIHFNPANTAVSVPAGGVQAFATGSLSNLGPGVINGFAYIGAGAKGDGGHVSFSVPAGGTADISVQASLAGPPADVSPVLVTLEPDYPGYHLATSWQRLNVHYHPSSEIPPRWPQDSSNCSPCQNCYKPVLFVN